MKIQLTASKKEERMANKTSLAPLSEEAARKQREKVASLKKAQRENGTGKAQVK